MRLERTEGWSAAASVGRKKREKRAAPEGVSAWGGGWEQAWPWRGEGLRTQMV